MAHVQNSIFVWTTSLNSFPQFERRHCCLSSPDGQPRSLAGPVCVREPLCLLEPSPPFSILVSQNLFYFCLDQVGFFSHFHVTNVQLLFIISHSNSGLLSLIHGFILAKLFYLTFLLQANPSFSFHIYQAAHLAIDKLIILHPYSGPHPDF